MPAPAAKRGSARTKARKRALDVLFEADLRQAPALEILRDQTDLGEPPVRPFTTELVEGVERHRAEIDQLVAEGLAGGWTLERMPRVDRNLARIAVYEIVFTEVADEVAAAECVALAQELSTDDSAVFLNGLLRTVAGRRAAGTI
ncbi:MAG: transcription antitermination factor NusB [Propionicimonas sp.]|nr:transcription antitermination factor NusB [Propionicimonas sp.]